MSLRQNLERFAQAVASEGSGGSEATRIRDNLDRHIANLEHEVEQLRAWRKHVLDHASKRAALELPPTMLIQKDVGRLPGDSEEHTWVLKQSYDEAMNSARISFSAVEAMKQELKAIIMAAESRLAQYEIALRFYAAPDQWTKDGDAIADEGQTARDALMSRRTVFLYAEGVEACERKVKEILKANDIAHRDDDTVGDLVRAAILPLKGCLIEIASNAQNLLNGGLPHFSARDFASATLDRAKAALEGRYR